MLRGRLCVTVLLTLSAATLGLVSLLLLAMKPHTQLATPVGEDFFTARLLRADGAVGAYRTELTVGDKQVVTLLDTGSDALWLREGKDKRQFEVVSQSSNVFRVEYMGGVAQGVVGVSALSILNYTWDQPLGVVRETTESINGLDSILGLSRTCNIQSTCPLEHWNLQSDVFSFFVDKGTGEGVFQAGVVDEARCDVDDQLRYTPLLGGDLAGLWAVSVSFLGLDHLRAVLDSGTTNIFLKKPLYEKFMETVGGQCSSSSLPTLSLRIGDVDFLIPSSVYATTPAFRDCRFRVQILEDKFPEDILVGATFLVNFFVVFDRANERVGLCRPHASPQFLLSVPTSVKEFFSLGS